MDQTVAPTVATNAGSTLTAATFCWVGASHYQITNRDSGADVCPSDLTFDVSGAKDLAGNTQVAATSVSSATSVDTQNATVASVGLDDANHQITDADRGQTVTATNTFSEAMDQTVAPTVATNAGSAPTPAPGSRVDATHHQLSYPPSVPARRSADLTFDVSGAKDLAGNTQVAATSVSSATSVDTQNATVA